MKVREIIAERQQLTEAAPLAFLAPYLPAALAWIATAGWLTILGWGVAAWSTAETVIKMKGIVEAEGTDPTKWKPETQYDVAGDIAATAVAAALGPAWKAAKGTYDKVWKTTPPEIKKEAFDKAIPEIEKVIAKTGVKPKDPNLVDKPFSKDVPAATTAEPKVAPKVRDPNKVERPYSKEVPSTTPPVKDPNRVERPFSKV